ncbi:MAG: hypothetical protein ABMA64_15485 [Myxococcota bacterium]
MREAMWCVVVLMGCGGDKTTDSGDTGSETDTDTDADSDTDTDTDTDADTDTCVALQTGVWVADGPAFGMAMTGTLTMDAAACTFTLGDWDMMMDSPSGGSVSGDQVSFEGSPDWATCLGTADAAGTSVTGSCDFGTYTMTAQ